MDCTKNRYSKSICCGNLPKIALINPNTSASITSSMVRVAKGSLGKGFKILGYTARRGVKLITEPKDLAIASKAVEELAPLLKKMDATVVAAFGDPGLYELRRLLPMPVTGIAEASMRKAGKRGRPFAVVTTTPKLRELIAKKASYYGYNNFKGTWTIPGDPIKHLDKPNTLKCILADAINASVASVALPNLPSEVLQENCWSDVAIFYLLLSVEPKLHTNYLLTVSKRCCFSTCTDQHSFY